MIIIIITIIIIIVIFIISILLNLFSWGFFYFLLGLTVSHRKVKIWTINHTCGLHPTDPS